MTRKKGLVPMNDESAYDHKIREMNDVEFAAEVARVNEVFHDMQDEKKTFTREWGGVMKEIKEQLRALSDQHKIRRESRTISTRKAEKADLEKQERREKVRAVPPPPPAMTA